MKGQWKEVVKLAFRGQRFEGHALDLTALGELSQFQKMVAETAKALWRAAHPDRERVPKGFQQRTRLCLRKIEEGSAVAPLEVFLEEPEHGELFPAEPVEVDEAIALAHQVFEALERDEPLPENFPKSLVPEYERWGQGLAEDETIELILPGKKPARLTQLSRRRLAGFAEASHQDQVDVTGEVMEADVRQGRFQIWLDEKTGVAVTFSPEQENDVTEALRQHRTLRLRVRGRGDFSPQGKLLRVNEVQQLQLQPAGDRPYDAAAPAIEDVLHDLARQVPQEDWRNLPPDLTDNLDHYLYGTPKR